MPVELPVMVTELTCCGGAVHKADDADRYVAGRGAPDPKTHTKLATNPVTTTRDTNKQKTNEANTETTYLLRLLKWVPTSVMVPPAHGIVAGTTALRFGSSNPGQKLLSNRVFAHIPITVTL
jgi:hypothetical protein